MSEKIVVPVLGESITEATVAKWLKKTGDAVEADEPIVELETDKVNLEVPSLGSVSENGAAKVTPTEKKEEPKKVEETPPENNVIKLDTNKKEPQIFEEQKQETKKPKPLVLTEEVAQDLAPIRENRNDTLSPAVRKIVTENNIDIGSVQGSGKNGQVVKGDLISLMGANPKPSERKIVILC